MSRIHTLASVGSCAGSGSGSMSLKQKRKGSATTGSESKRPLKKQKTESIAEAGAGHDDEETANVKAGKGSYGKIVKTSKKGPVTVKDSALGFRWKMDKTQDNKIMTQLKTAIGASKMYAVAQITETDKSGKIITEIKGDVSGLSAWILIGNGDGANSAVVVKPKNIEREDGSTGYSLENCTLAAGKIKKALICVIAHAGMKKDVFDSILERGEALPKSKRAFAVLFETFNKLQKQFVAASA